MTVETALLQSELLPALEPNAVLDTNWMRQFINKLKGNQDNVIEATRTLLTTLEEDYQTADSFISASFTEEIGVLTDAVSATAVRITTLESQVQTPSTGLLARVTTVESTVASQGSAVATLQTTVASNVTSISTLNGNITTINGQITTLTSSISTTNGNVSSLTTTVSSHTTSISSINGSITTLSSSVSTNATAITTLAGVVNAYYAIKVAAGTNIATIEAMATGSAPSTVVITAGQIQLNGNVVVTGTITATQIAVNSVTQGYIYEGDSGVTVTTSWTSLGSITGVVVPDADTLVKLDWAFFVDVPGSPLEALEVKIVRASSDIYYTIAMTQPPEISFYTDADGQFDIPLPIQNNCCGFDSDQPGAGTYTYTLYAKGSFGNWTLTYRRLFGMKFVR